MLWRDILSQFIDRFGFGESAIERMRKEKEIALITVDMIVSGDKSKKTLIDIVRDELETIQKESTGGEFWEIKSSIEQYMKFSINPMRTSVGEFYSYLKLIEKQIKKNGREANKK